MTHEDTSTAVDALRAWLGALIFSEPLTHGSLAIYPARAADGQTSPLRYTLLCEAIANGQIVVREKPRPTVPILEIENYGETPVLILSGEEVVGGLQNRIVRTTALLPPRTTWDIAVLCVEAGRWHPEPPSIIEDDEPAPPAGDEPSNRPPTHRGDERARQAAFRYGGKELFSLRRARHTWIRDHEGRIVSAVDQRTQWAAIHAAQTRAAVSSPTQAMRDLYDSRADRLARFRGALPYPDGALGMVIAIGDQVAGADIFDQAHSAAVMWPTLVDSYALDAVDEPASSPPDVDEVRRFVTRAAAAETEATPGLGLGTDVRLVSELVTGQALVYEAIPVYTALFRRPHRASAAHPRVQRFSSRLRRQLGS